MKKSICFILPIYGTNPVGGVKVVYEYANRFCKAGYSVGIFYPRVRIDFSSSKSFLRTLYYFFRGLVLRHYKAGKWFALEKGVRQFLISPLKKNKICKKLSFYDVACATSVETAYYLNTIFSGYSCKKIYLIQGYEAWGEHDDNYVFDSYRFPFVKIVIAPWLLEKVHSTGESAELIYNGFDFNHFSLESSIEERSPYEISMLYHTAAHKRTEDCIDALSLVHEKYPKVHVTAFGTPVPPVDLPEWITYIRMPEKKRLNEIYNSSSIYVAASESEGFGLTVGEAMICGNAVCCTDNAGFSCMVKDSETGLLAPVRDVSALAKNIERLIDDSDLRFNLAKSGNDFIQQFTWERAFEKFQAVVEQ